MTSTNSDKSEKLELKKMRTDCERIMLDDMVQHPEHYGGKNNVYEVIKVCEAWGLHNDAYLFNVVKYVARAGKKNPLNEIEDLKKALFYLERKINNLQPKIEIPHYERVHK